MAVAGAIHMAIVVVGIGGICVSSHVLQFFVSPWNRVLTTWDCIIALNAQG